MANRYESLAIFLYPFDPDSGGTIRWKSDVIVSGVTNVNWTGAGELLAATRDGVKRVRCQGDGVVTVEDAVSVSNPAMSSQEVARVSAAVADYFGVAGPERPADVTRDVATFLSRARNE